jgi:hypothetical protein
VFNIGQSYRARFENYGVGFSFGRYITMHGKIFECCNYRTQFYTSSDLFTSDFGALQYFFTYPQGTLGTSDVTLRYQRFVSRRSNAEVQSAAATFTMQPADSNESYSVVSTLSGVRTSPSTEEILIDKGELTITSDSLSSAFSDLESFRISFPA